MPSMPSDHKNRSALCDIRDNALLAREFVAGLSPNAFAADCRAFYAVTRCLEIISEAARRLSPALRERHPHLPWRAIMDSGNVYRHDYGNVVKEFVWKAVDQDLAPLLEMVEIELAALNAG
jgi:uncharacterized protein with HEPN domain